MLLFRVYKAAFSGASFADSSAYFQIPVLIFRILMLLFTVNFQGFQCFFSRLFRTLVLLFTISDPSFADSNASFHESGASFQVFSRFQNHGSEIVKKLLES